jgi:hypothetical protein
MEQITRWKQFIENPHNNQVQSGNILMVILDKALAPKSPLAIPKEKINDRDEWKALGYAFDADGKCRRNGRFYISQEMEKIEEWCKTNNLHWSWDIKPTGGPFMDGKYLEIHGELKSDMLQTFPVKHLWIQII